MNRKAMHPLICEPYTSWLLRLCMSTFYVLAGESYLSLVKAEADMLLSVNYNTSCKNFLAPFSNSNQLQSQLFNRLFKICLNGIGHI